MSEALATIYSRTDAFKRKLIDALRNPGLAAEQIVGDANDRARVLNEATTAAVDESIATRNPVDNGPANQRLAQMIAGAYAPIGMTKKYPQAEALEAARSNAVKMLRLPENNTAMDRAKALGFDTPVYRGTTAAETAGKQRTFASENPDVANQYAGYLSQFADDPKMLDAMMKLTPNGNVMPLLVRDAAKARARTNAPDYEMILDANQARSRFAAFDPARVNENDLLAGMLPLGAMALPQNEKGKKKDNAQEMIDALRKRKPE